MIGKHRAVFLDRDGVINRSVIRDGKPYPPVVVAQLEVLPGVGEALADLRKAGFRLIVVTNQPDVARGTQSRETVEAINRTLAAALPLDSFRICYHDDHDRCSCRKPAAGLILDAAREENIDLAGSYLVGDRWRDMEAGYSAGCTTIFVDHGYNEKQPHRFHRKVASLREAADWILSNKRSEHNEGG